MTHPCFNKDAHASYGRMHLPVAPACNILCGYCDRKFSCVNESRPGVTARVIAPAEALKLALKAVAAMPHISVAGIAGPGDPLANPAETLETLKLVHEALPNLHLCLATNGLNLPQHIDELYELGLRFLTVTVNAIDPETGGRIYRHVIERGQKLIGTAGAALLQERQFEGIARAKALGMTVKINTVIVPGINDCEAQQIARKMRALGADMMNCIPMLPVKDTQLAAYGEPTPETMHELRERAGQWLPQMRHCGRCRADALGLLTDGFALTDLR